MTAYAGFVPFKKRWESNVEKFNEYSKSLTAQDAKVIVSLNESKSAFENAIEYGNSLGLVFSDPNKPKQTLARSLAEIIVTRSQS